MDEVSDLALVEAWRAGDKEAANTLMRRHLRSVFWFFRTKTDGDVADLVQQTFLGCVESQHRFAPEVQFRPFLLGIARKVLLMHLRKQHRRQRVIQPGAPATAPDGATRLSGLAALREEQRVLLTALRRLPLWMQTVLELHYWEGMQTSDIAVVLGAPRNTVKSRLRLARARLKEEFAAIHATSLADASDQQLVRWASEIRRTMVDPTG